MLNVTIDINYLSNEEKESLLQLLEKAYTKKFNAYKDMLTEIEVIGLEETLEKGLDELEDYASLIERKPYDDYLILYNRLLDALLCFINDYSNKKMSALIDTKKY